MPGRLEPDPIPRRDFIGIYGLWAAALAIFGSILGMMRLPKPRVTPEASTKFRAGTPAEFSPGTVKVIPEYNVRLLATEQGFAAMSLICPHLGCVVRESVDGFLCPCHGSRFSLQGTVLAGPAPRDLQWLSITQAIDGSLVVDTAQETEPGTFFQV